MQTKFLPLFLLSLFVLLHTSGCGDDDGGTPEDGGAPEDGGNVDSGPRTFTGPECENVNQWHCLMPWPSSRYLAEDPSTATGYRIDIPEKGLADQELSTLGLRQVSREVDPQDWPQTYVKFIPAIAPRIASSMSASGYTIQGFFPPSSIRTSVVVSAAFC